MRKCMAAFACEHRGSLFLSFVKRIFCIQVPSNVDEPLEGEDSPGLLSMGAAQGGLSFKRFGVSTKFTHAASKIIASDFLDNRFYR